MALLSMDATAELCDRYGRDIFAELPSIREKLCTVEFVVRNTKTKAPWLPSAAREERTAAVLSGGEEKEMVRTLGPSVSYYAPLGGRLSKEFREALRYGVTRLLTQLVVQRLLSVEQEEVSRINTCSDFTAFAPFVSIHEISHNRKEVCVHWSPELLQVLLSRADAGTLRLTVSLPSDVTLIPIARELRARNVQHHMCPETPSRDVDCEDLSVGNNVHGPTEKNVDFVHQVSIVMERVEIVSQSVHDKRTADRLAYFLYLSYLKPAEQMREAGGDAIHAQRYGDALDCYCRALSVVQQGLLVPYRRALRPPSSLEDRLERGVGEDITDEANLIASGPWAPSAGAEGPCLAPANRYFNVLLRLKDNGASWLGGKELSEMAAESLLSKGRAVFPHAHPLLHVWYCLHRQAVVAVANVSQSLILLQPLSAASCFPLMPDSELLSSGLSFKELSQKQARAARWCERCLVLLQRVNVWLGDCFRKSTQGTTKMDEWIWVLSMRSKILLRRAKLLRFMGTFDEYNHALRAVNDQLRALQNLSAVASCATEVQKLCDEVRGQLVKEKSLPSGEYGQGGGLVLRL